MLALNIEDVHISDEEMDHRIFTLAEKRINDCRKSGLYSTQKEFSDWVKKIKSTDQFQPLVCQKHK